MDLNILSGNLAKNKVYDVNKITFKISEHNLEIHNEVKEKDGACGTYGERRNVYRNFVGYP